MIAISVIIPTLNRSQLLNKTLESILGQLLAPERYEVIVIDNGSTDNTREVCELFGPRFENFRYIFDSNPGLHVGRHRGLRESKAEILVFADDDIRAFDTWLLTIFDAFQHPGVGMVGGKNLPEFESPPPRGVGGVWITTREGRYITQYSLLDLGDVAKSTSPYYVFGCNFAIRKSLLLRVGGFNPDGMPKKLIARRGDGESKVAQRVSTTKYETIYHPKASVHHWVSSSRLTLQYVHDRSYDQGISDSYTRTRLAYLDASLRRRSSIQRNLLRLKHRLQDFRKALKSTDSTDEVAQVVAKGYLAGFEFHQRAVRQDPELLAWVLKPTYLDLT